MDEGTVDTGRGRQQGGASGGEYNRDTGNTTGVDGSSSDARNTMSEGASGVDDGSVGESNRGRDPEYYGQDHDQGE